MIIALTIGMGLLIGLSLGALGGGGSILTVPALVYVIGQGAKEATTSSLFIVGISALIGALGHHRSGRVRWSTGVAFGITGIAASFAGTAANRLVQPDVLLLAFAVLILVAAAGMFAKTRESGRRTAPDDALVSAGSAPAPGSPAATTAGQAAPSGTDWNGRRIAKVVAAGLVVGFMTGFFGVGGGFVIVPALTLALGMGMPEAVATSLVVIAINSGAALLFRAGTAHFDWAVIVPFTVAAIAGSLTGKKVADKLDARTLTRAFAVLLVAVAVYTATQSVLGLLG